GIHKAIWAIAHRIAKVVWKVLHDKVHYIERGPMALDPLAMKRRVTKLARQMRRLGYTSRSSQLRSQPHESLFEAGCFREWTSRVRVPSPAPYFQRLGRIQQLLPLLSTPLSRGRAVFLHFCGPYRSRIGFRHLRQNRLLQHLRSPPPCFNTGMRIDIEGHSDTVAPLISCYLRVNLGIMAKTRMRAAQNLEIRPTEANRVQLGLHVSVPDVVPPERLRRVLGGEYPCVGLPAHQRHPFPQ